MTQAHAQTLINMFIDIFGEKLQNACAVVVKK